jgi:hypothetical protein
MFHTCGNILLQLVFSTRERRPLIKPEFAMTYSLLRQSQPTLRLPAPPVLCWRNIGAGSLQCHDVIGAAKS